MAAQARAGEAHRRSLMAGSPLYSMALARQRQNLVSFYAAHADEFAQMPYHPWVDAPLPGEWSFAQPVSVRVSGLETAQPLQGVYLQQPLRTAKHCKPVLYYPGLLVTAPLLEKFNEQYYCPTALRLPSLDYKAGNGPRVEMLIIGDPTSPGAIVNDGTPCNVPNNCALESVRPSMISRVTKMVGDKTRVSPQVCFLHVLPNKQLGPSDELLAGYGGEEFWSLLGRNEEYCSTCFSRLCDDEDNPLVQCSGSDQGRACVVSRHRKCFPAPWPTMDELSDQSDVHFLCPKHFHLAPAPTIRPRPLDPPKFSPPIFASAIQFTPPHVSAPLHAPRAVAPTVLSPAAAGAPSPSVRRSLANQLSESTSQASFISQPRSSSPPFVSTSFNSHGPDDVDMTSDGAWLASDNEPEDEMHAGQDDDEHVPESGDAASSGRSSGSESQDDSDSNCSDDARQASVRHGAQSRRNLADPPGSVQRTSSARRAPRLQLRKQYHVQKMADMSEHSTPLNAAQRLKVAELLLGCCRNSKKKPWYIPQWMYELARSKSSGASVPPSSRASVASSSSSSSSTAQLTDEEVDAILKESKGTSNRWYMPQSIVKDWAEYRSCCGKPENVHSALMNLTAQEALSHSSVSVVKMFHHRLLHRQQADSPAAYNRLKGNDLRSLQSIRWLDGSVCHSCYRALLGCGRSGCFSLPHAITAADVDEDLMANQPAQAESEREKAQLVRVVNLLLSYAKERGQNPPNPRNKDPAAQLWMLPHVRKCDARAAVEDFERSRTNNAAGPPISPSTFGRALDYLRVKLKVTLSMSSSKEVCRCNHCELFGNKLDPTEVLKLSPKEIMDIKAQKKSHLRTMQELRRHLDKQKQHAVAHPTELFCIMLDGMDQSKTQLPSRVRLAKDLDTRARLKVHIVGAFCFGGPKPVMGLVNFPDVRKDSALSVTTVDKILDMQWQELERKWELLNGQASATPAHSAGPDPMDTDEHTAAASAAPASAAPAFSNDSADPAAAAAAPIEGVHSQSPYQGIGMHWPRRLHVSFDNAVSECKNQWMFRYLGALVLHGVFEYITVSTLLVGHTHDIVDQMFSVWAKLLRIHDAETYEKMRALFHEKYHARIQGLVAMMRGDLEAAAAADADLNAHEAANMVEEERQGLHGSRRAAEWNSKAQWSPEAADKLAAFANEMSRDTGMQPEITLQTLSVNVQAWLSKANGASKAPDRQLPNIGTPHVFAVEKDPETGDVYLYNKFLVSSTNHSERGERHLYMSQLSGSYTSRALLYRADEVITIDPSRNPPLKIDTDELRDTVDAYGRLEAMGPTEIKQYCAMLDRLDQAQAEIAEICVECKQFIEQLNSIGVVRRGKNASKADLDLANIKDKHRTKANKSLDEHLNDPSFAAQHGRLVQHGWWTKWLDRVKNHILPAFVERGIVVNPAHHDLSYHIHPSALVSNGTEPPLFESDTRVDVSWLREHGAPTPGDIAIVRSNDPKTPLWLCEIIGRVDKKESSERRAEAAAAAGSEAAGLASGRGASASGFGYHHHRDRARLAAAGLSLSELPPYQVKWWDLYAQDCTLLKLLDDAHWEHLFNKHGTSAAEILLNATAENPHFPRWLVNKYQSVRFAVKTPTDLGEVPATSLIVWGPSKKIVTATHKIKPTIWERVLRDLTEGSAEEEAEVVAASGGQRDKSKRKHRKTSKSPQQKKARATSPSSSAASAAASESRPPSSRAAAALARASFQRDGAKSDGSESDRSESDASEEAEEAEELDSDEAPLHQLASQRHALKPARAAPNRPDPATSRTRASANKRSGRSSAL